MFGRGSDMRAWEWWLRVAVLHGVGPLPDTPTLALVCGRRQQARTGCKGFVRFPPFEVVHAAWFPGWWPPIGAYVAVTGHWWTDVASTHHHEVVFWVDVVLAVVDVDTVRRAERHQRRLDRRAAGGANPRVAALPGGLAKWQAARLVETRPHAPEFERGAVGAVMDVGKADDDDDGLDGIELKRRFDLALRA